MVTLTTILASLHRALAWRPGGYLRASGALFGWLAVRTLAQTVLFILVARTLGALDALGGVLHPRAGPAAEVEDAGARAEEAEAAVDLLELVDRAGGEVLLLGAHVGGVVAGGAIGELRLA